MSSEEIDIHNRVLYLILNYEYGTKPIAFLPETDTEPPF